MYFELIPSLGECYKTMSATTMFKQKAYGKFLPIIHIDGTARIQIASTDTVLGKLLICLEKFNIKILANSSLNISGDPTCFDLFDGLMVCSLTPLKYLLTDFGLIKKIE